MDIGFEYRARTLTVTPEGELDHHAAKPLMTAIGDRIDTYLPGQCVLDLKGLTFMDSSGIAVILKTYKRMKELGGQTWVENAGKQPMKIISMSGIERLVKIVY